VVIAAPFLQQACKIRDMSLRLRLNLLITALLLIFMLAVGFFIINDTRS